MFYDIAKKEGFNPRPHAEGDGICFTILQKRRVSIHALTRRATANVETGCATH